MKDSVQGSERISLPAGFETETPRTKVGSAQPHGHLLHNWRLWEDVGSNLSSKILAAPRCVLRFDRIELWTGEPSLRKKYHAGRQSAGGLGQTERR